MKPMTMTSPASEAAAKYMAHKGYPDLIPTNVEKVEDLTCWYYTYELPEGWLELEVEFVDGDWKFTTMFMEE